MRKLSLPSRIPESPSFKGFEINDCTDQTWMISGYRRNLPHLSLCGATYFITFRLADSIPRQVMEKWICYRNNWLLYFGIDSNLYQTNPEAFKQLYSLIPANQRYLFEKEQRRTYFIELNKCHGSCILSKFHFLVAEALEFFNGKRVWLGDYVIMPNHVHAIIQPFPGVKLEEWLYSVKRYSSFKIKKHQDSLSLNLDKNIWQRESFDRIIRNTWELRKIRSYIEKNPANLHEGTFFLKKMDWLDKYSQKQ